MGIEVDAFIETLREGASPDASGYSAHAQLYLDRTSGLQLHVLSGSDGDPPYKITNLSHVAAERFSANQDRISDPYEIQASDSQLDQRKANVKGVVTKEVEAALAALRVLGPNARLVFWYWG